MEELVEIIINLITKMMSAPKQQKQPGRPPMMPSTPQTPSPHGGAPYKPIPAARALPPSRAAVKPKAPPRRVRRQQPPAMMAAPIVTSIVTDAPPPPQQTIRTTAVKPISSTQPTKAPAALDASAFRRWLTPATLRQQFMLTEIFQPPLALRRPPEQR